MILSRADQILLQSRLYMRPKMRTKIILTIFRAVNGNLQALRLPQLLIFQTFLHNSFRNTSDIITVVRRPNNQKPDPENRLAMREGNLALAKTT